MKFVEGRIFTDVTLSQLSKDERTAIYKDMAAVLAKIHCTYTGIFSDCILTWISAVNLQAVGLTNFGKGGDYYQRQIKTWSSQYENSKLEEIPEMDRLTEWLSNNIPSNNGI